MAVKNRVYYLWITVLMVLTIGLSPVSATKDAFFPLNLIKPGMSGVGYTVFQGTKVEPFNVKVVDVINSDYGDEHLILVRLSGKRIEENGGLAAGMSGSPIYIKGKLAGAVSYGFENADPMLALVTPIQAMFKLMDKGNIQVSLGERHQRPVPVATPVMVSGMSRRGFEMMSRILEAQQLKPVFLPGISRESDGSNPFAVKPGSAIAVQLVSGDYQASAIGTVTWINSDYFLAFGHSFMNKGQVDYNVFQAEISQTVQSRIMSFKVGFPKRPIGKIIEDRHAGILGKFGQSPEMIEVAVEVQDLDRNITRQSRFRVIHNEQLYPELIISGVTAAIDKAIDRVGEGTAKVVVKFDTLQKNGAISRNNIFYSKDIAVSCVKDLDSLLSIIANNEFRKIDLQSVKIEMQITKAQTTARVIKLETENTKVKPGSTLILKAVLHTYRGSNFNIPFKVTLPENLQPGKLVLTVRGGAETAVQGKDEEKPSEIKLDTGKINTFDDVLTAFFATPRNNQLVLEYFPVLKDQKEISATGNEPLRQLADSDYYIVGETQLALEVE